MVVTARPHVRRPGTTFPERDRSRVAQAVGAEIHTNGLVRPIMRAAARAAQMEQSKFLDGRGPRDVAHVRHVGFWLSYHVTQRSMPDISRAFNRRDATSVIYGVRRIERLLNEGCDLTSLYLSRIASELSHECT